MTKLKTIGLAGILAATGAILPIGAEANTVTLYSTPWSYSNGGEFAAVTTPGLYNANYVPNVTEFTVSGVTAFETFCVQTAVEFTPGTSYNFTQGLTSVGNPDNFSLSAGTAYLYWQFATGQLGGYNYTDTSTRIVDAGELQAAIWALQGGQVESGFGYSGTGNGVTGNPFYNDALNALGAGNITAAVNSTNNYGVQILNLTTTSGNSAAQNQLVYTGGGTNTHHQNVPDSGTAAALMSLSLAGLGAFARRMNARQQSL